MIQARNAICVIIILSSILFAWQPQVLGQNHTSLSFRVNYIYRSAGRGELKPISEGSILNSGDHYKIVFTPNQYCHVYIFQVDSSGQIFQLFPMDAFKDVQVYNINPVMAGRKYILPAADKAFVLDETTGTERIYFIGSTVESIELMKLTDKASTKAPSAENRANLSHSRYNDEPTNQSRETPQEKLERFFKERGVVLVNGPEKVSLKWENQEDIFTVFEKRLLNVCSGCVQTIRFIHK